MGKGPLRKVLTLGAGGVLVAIGVTLLILPGPGLLLVLAGLVVLAREFPAVRTFVAPVRERAMDAAHTSVSSPWRLAGSVVAAAALVGAGVAWGLVPSLPLGGWSTGTGLIVSGLCLGGLLWWSHRQVRAERAERAARTPDAGRPGDGG